jgi:hypothetical protein
MSILNAALIKTELGPYYMCKLNLITVMLMALNEPQGQLTS